MTETEHFRSLLEGYAIDAISEVGLPATVRVTAPTTDVPYFAIVVAKPNGEREIRFAEHERIATTPEGELRSRVFNGVLHALDQ